MVGMGYTGVARWEDPSASYLNPASGAFYKGLSATTLNTITFGAGEFLVRAILEQQDIPRQPNWLDALAPDMWNRYWEIGWTKEFNHWLYKRVALRVSGTKLNLGTVTGIDENGNYLGTWSPFDLAKSINLSVLFPYGIGLGYTFKYVYSFLAPREIVRIVTGEEIGGEARTFTNDYGLLFDPGLGFALGFAVHNDGGSMRYTYIDSSHVDPMPTYIRYGFSLKFDDLFQFLTGVSLSPLISLTYSRDWIKDRVGTQHETWYGEGYEIGALDLFFYRRGTFKDPLGMRAGRTEGWGIRFGSIRLDIADDGKIYLFDQPNNWWVSLSLQTPQNEGFIDQLIGKKAMGWIQAVLFPGAGHIYKGNERGLLYSALSSFLYSTYLRNGGDIFLIGAYAIYASSLIDFYLWR